MKTRTAAASEAEVLTALINSAFELEKFFVEGDRITVEQVREFFQKGEFLVLDGEHSLDGCIYVEQRGDRTYFGLLSIDPTRQGAGLGKRLVAAGEEWARARGCRYMDMRIINLREELPGFYKRLGYSETGVEALSPEISTKLPCHFVNFTKALA